MPIAHGPIFCRKKLQEKVEVKVRFFNGVSQPHGPTFYRRQNIRPTLGFFIGVSFGAVFYQNYCAVTMAGEVPLLDYVTVIF